MTPTRFMVRDHVGIIVGYGLWPEFYGSFGPEGWADPKEGGWSLELQQREATRGG